MFILETVSSQNLMYGDSLLLMPFARLAPPGASLMLFRITQDYDYSLTSSGLLFFNWKQDRGPGQAAILQHFNVRSKLTNDKNLQITGAWNHELGIQVFFDSISRFYPDGNTVDIKAELKSGRKTNCFFSVRFTTRLFNGYDIVPDTSGGYRHVLNSAFLTPLVCTFSGGVNWLSPSLGSFNLGLTGAKLTYVRDKTIYDELNIREFYGVPGDKNFNIEYGITLHLLINKDLLKFLHWDFDLLAFKNFRKPVDISIKNQVGIKISKYLKGMIQTKLLYNEVISKHIQLENLLSAGVSLKF